jgi:hypothetical protein
VFDNHATSRAIFFSFISAKSSKMLGTNLCTSLVAGKSDHSTVLLKILSPSLNINICYIFANFLNKTKGQKCTTEIEKCLY